MVASDPHFDREAYIAAARADIAVNGSGRTKLSIARKRGPQPKPARKPKTQPMSKREAYLQNKYGIGVGEFNAMMESQGRRCDICRTQLRVSVNVAVDHNHDTGAVRGLLCLTCNSGIGMLKDDPAVVLAAHEYLTRHLPGANTQSA